MGRTLVLHLLAGLLLLGSAPAARATSVERFDLQELTRRAEVIVHGRCTGTESRKDAQGMIVTDVHLEVVELFKVADGADKSVKRLTFTIYGGVVGNRGSTIHGAPTFTKDEEVLLFLGEVNANGLRTCVGLSQGKYSIRVDQGKKLAFRNLEGLTLIDRATGEVLDPGKPDQGVPFEELRQRVRTHLESK